jgi:trafficking kinesin-binding protein 1
VEIVSLLEEQLPRYTLRQDFLTKFQGAANADWVIQTPVLPAAQGGGLTPEQAGATLDYLVSCGDRLTQMTKTYHDVEAVTRLLAEKEKDLELAAKIGQELLQRNKETEERAARLEQEGQAASDIIIQLKHELQAKTDLLHVYTDDLEESSPLELRSINVELLQRKIDDLEQDNKTLHAEAFSLAQEAYKCEEKEEKLVKDAVQHLTQANYQIKDLHSQFTYKVSPIV